MSGKQTNSDSESEKELEGSFQDDDFLVSKENLSNLSNLLNFPSEAYNIASSTPIGTPTASPKKSKVKILVEKLEESGTNSRKTVVKEKSKHGENSQI